MATASTRTDWHTRTPVATVAPLGVAPTSAKHSRGNAAARSVWGQPPPRTRPTGGAACHGKRKKLR
jgi:hypothetical protein